MGKKMGTLTKVLAVIVNVVVIVALVGGLLLVASLVSEDPDESDCQPPKAAATAAKTEARPGAARQRLKEARTEAKANPSARTRKEVRAARAELRSAVKQVKRWQRGAVVTISEATPTTFQLGHDINAGPRSIRFTLSRRVLGPEYLPVQVHPFASSTTSELDEDDIKAWARLDPTRRAGVLTFCLLPEVRTQGGGAGVFSGDLALVSRRTDYAEVPVTFSAPYPRTSLVALVGITVCLLCSVYVFILRLPSLPDLTLYGKADPDDLDKERSTRLLRTGFGFVLGYWRWTAGYAGVITFVAGLIGAVTAFKLQYLSSDSWSGTLGEWLTYCGAVATAFIAAGTAGRLAQNKYDEPTGTAVVERHEEV
jgi:hypothetical protein